MMTEEKAKGKWCPFARIAHYPTDECAPKDIITSHNRLSCEETGEDRRPLASRCIPSECMAWRWGSKIEPGQMIDAKDLSYPEIKELIAERSDTKGYCGLAGRP